MKRLTVALLQMTSCGSDQAANLVKGEDFCRRGKAMGADIALFPEMWNVGYSDFDPAGAIGADSEFVLHFRALALALEMAIALTYLERWPGKPRNTVCLIDRHGEVALTYAKVHTCDFDREAALTPGAAFPVCTLDTAAGDVNVGAMICYDREFPESARLLMLGGAEVILTPNACTLDPVRLAQFQTRAFENMVAVALTNYAAPQCNGHSIAYDGIAFSGTDGYSRDMLVVEAGETEGIYPAAFDLHALREYRGRETWGDSYRKPGCYGRLTAAGAAAPFIRPDARRQHASSSGLD